MAVEKKNKKKNKVFGNRIYSSPHNSAARHHYRGLTWLGRACRAGGAPVTEQISITSRLGGVSGLDKIFCPPCKRKVAKLSMNDVRVPEILIL